MSNSEKKEKNNQPYKSEKKLVAGIVGFVEGIIYITKSDEDFDQTYVKGHKGWF